MGTWKPERDTNKSLFQLLFCVKLEHFTLQTAIKCPDAALILTREHVIYGGGSCSRNSRTDSLFFLLSIGGDNAGRRHVNKEDQSRGHAACHTQLQLKTGSGSGSVLATGQRCCTYTRAGLDGIAGKEANVFSGQDSALKPRGDNRVTFICGRDSTTISRQRGAPPSHRPR